MAQRREAFHFSSAAASHPGLVRRIAAQGDQVAAGSLVMVIGERDSG